MLPPKTVIANVRETDIMAKNVSKAFAPLPCANKFFCIKTIAKKPADKIGGLYKI